MKYLLILCIAGGLVACGTTDNKAGDASAAAGKGDTASKTSIQWLDTIDLNLGKVKEGQVVEVAYRFRNAGTKPLYFISVSASCGCTVPEKPDRPYAAGEEGVIKAKFDSKGRPHGEARKEVYVEANTIPQSQTLSFKVEITD